jgi:hypothetical protein
MPIQTEVGQRLHQPSMTRPATTTPHATAVDHLAFTRWQAVPLDGLVADGPELDAVKLGEGDGPADDT